MLFKEAQAFIENMYKECHYETQIINKRLHDIELEIIVTGIYNHHGKVALLNAASIPPDSFMSDSIGRLSCLDSTPRFSCARDVTDEASFLSSITYHITQATNEGKLKPYITIYAPKDGPKIFNNQLIRYAGYDNCGDPAEKEVTRLANHLGWKGKGTNFDVLPLIYQLPNESVKFYEYPTSLIKEVPIEHNHYPKLRKLNLKWYAVPIISNMDLKIGGIVYPTAPFNGWYMVTEIGVRNFIDDYRYNLLEKVADAFEFDTLKNNSFNKDRALVELNYAVYHSFKKEGVSIVDHLTAAKQFELFERNEAQQGRQVTGKWSWLAPPLSPTLTSNYHHGYDNTVKDPNFFYKKKESNANQCPFHH
ncbi:nitric oxide synthase oxygenase [Staphylococcus aureus]|nr:nitric oxide synthase oxygenase [Staphylococcus aureus]UIF31025.1 nitric oxide synthase oxygenase [Staphylococcus aureus]